MKTTKNSRFRAYARGSVDLYKRHTDFAVNARSNLNEAPRDVKRLECLRQPKDRSMSERYDAAVEKENTEWSSLIAAASAADTSKDKKGDDSGDENEDEEEADQKKEKQQKKKKQKKPVEAPPAPKEDRAVMNMQDDVEEGVDWSSDEE